MRSWIDDSSGTPKFKIETFGCKVNQYEGQVLREAFEREGFAGAAAGEPASVVVVNLCTVTATADSKGRKAIRRLARENPGAKLVVTGCIADWNRDKLSALPEVWRVVPNADKLTIPAIAARDSFRVGNMPMPLVSCTITDFAGHSRAFVKIQDGCDKGCSYCIVPHVRGKPVSKPFDVAVGEIRGLADRGFKEIVISGIHVGSYGNDLRPRRTLLDLLEELARGELGARLRLSSIEVGDLDGAFVDFMANSPLMCPHLHVPLQSGSNMVLAMMNRRYSSEQYAEKIAELRARLDAPAITTDVIVGFPGEEGRDFEQTATVCRACGFSKIHIFPFSPRRGTAAADLPGRCGSEELRRRLTELKTLERELAASFRSSLVGRTLRVLVEGRSDVAPRRRSAHAGKRSPARTSDGAATLTGFCEHYIRTSFNGPRSDTGKLVMVRCVGSEAGMLVGDRLVS